jgi:hypothetical protein
VHITVLSNEAPLSPALGESFPEYDCLPQTGSNERRLGGGVAVELPELDTNGTRSCT